MLIVIINYQNLKIKANEKFCLISLIIKNHQSIKISS
jgi:hypothetical protein